jgi:hypothetical protein
MGTTATMGMYVPTADGVAGVEGAEALSGIASINNERGPREREFSRLAKNSSAGKSKTDT